MVWFVYNDPEKVECLGIQESNVICMSILFLMSLFWVSQQRAFKPIKPIRDDNSENHFDFWVFSDTKLNTYFILWVISQLTWLSPRAVSVSRFGRSSNCAMIEETRLHNNVVHTLSVFLTILMLQRIFDKITSLPLALNNSDQHSYDSAEIIDPRNPEMNTQLSNQDTNGCWLWVGSWLKRMSMIVFVTLQLAMETVLYTLCVYFWTVELLSYYHSPRNENKRINMISNIVDSDHKVMMVTVYSEIALFTLQIGFLIRFILSQWDEIHCILMRTSSIKIPKSRINCAMSRTRKVILFAVLLNLINGVSLIIFQSNWQKPKHFKVWWMAVIMRMIDIVVVSSLIHFASSLSCFGHLLIDIVRFHKPYQIRGERDSSVIPHSIHRSEPGMRSSLPISQSLSPSNLGFRDYEGYITREIPEEHEEKGEQPDLHSYRV